ncbi:restriction endonuclease subunit S [Listeria monocytogenes]|uniref:restriction endonuclease subunit S n=2 Tax=Listeria monocytogenes TaxID=1639 RepID=UPI0004D7A167|nr:restriction endonuclease subunit S [Listeria monocytogenes]EAG6254887.1 restriction endonuclease subunit S [Listeria monocytogenes CFSAN003807]AHF37221.1 type I restriction enzyme, S subunit [Listeria monocytogenes serotype 1/2a str. 10-0815]AHF43153.1 type I restriction enzyme, S subunit [Listeria monocytogenes serotype 1/2a str. 88-0478]AIL67678.1 type I restriction modification protein [Listeria monocytogenes]APV02378.1 type I restriction endonuclease [Listeria monocytogenes]
MSFNFDLPFRAWEQRKLGEIANSFEYGLNASSKTYDGENKYIRITDIDESSHVFNQDNLTSPNISLDKLNHYLLEEGDILLARTGASTGKSYYYSKMDGKVFFAGFLIRAKIKQEYNVSFIFQNTLTERYNNFIQVTSQRSGQPGINAQEYARFALYIPELKEQQKIGVFFKQLDNAIALHQRKLDALKLMKKGFLQQMFPKIEADIPEIRFADFDGKWEQRKLGEIFNERSERSADGELISVTINSGVIKASKLEKKDNSSFDKSNYKVVKKGDIAYNSMRMWQGASGYSSYDGILSPAYTVIYPRKDIDTIFIAYMFKKIDMIQTFQRNSQGLTSDTWNLKFPSLSTIKIKIPANDEQIKITNLFQKLEYTSILHQNQIEMLKKVKKAYLQTMFI